MVCGLVVCTLLERLSVLTAAGQVRRAAGNWGGWDCRRGNRRGGDFLGQRFPAAQLRGTRLQQGFRIL